MSRSLHLVIFFISHPHQLLCQFPLINARLISYRNHISFQNVQRNLGSHQTIKSSHHCQGTPFHNPPQYFDPLFYQFVPVDIRLIKNEILRRIKHDIFIIKLIVLINFLRPKVTESNDDLIFKTIAQTIYHMQFLGIHAARQRRRCVRLFQKLCNLFEFPQFTKRCGKCPHL